MLAKLILLLYLELFALSNGQIPKSDKLSSSNASHFVNRWNYTSTKGIDRSENSDSNETSLAGGVGLQWWTQLPVLPLVFASSKTVPEGRCKKHVQLYLRDLAKSKLWAVQMFDASTKYPDGLIYGHTKHLGNFDQCYDLRAKLSSGDEEEVEGRYCLIRFRYQRKDVMITPPEAFTLDFDPNLNAWDAIDDRGDFRRVKRNSVYMALCVPASCSAEDVSTALTDPLRKLAEARGLRLEATVKPSLCQARRDAPKSFSTGTKVFCFVIATLVVLVIASSRYDSAIHPNASHHRGLDCIHLIRFFYTSIAIVGHRTMQYYGYPVVDSTYLEKAYTLPVSMMLFNGPIIIDGFLSLGGLLLAYGLLDQLDRRKRFNFIALILMRFFRLTPLYMAAVFFNATLMPRMGSGPFWEDKIGSERDFCAKNWWTNLLYINNYVNANEICMFQSWYLSVDFHLYILGLIVIWAFWKLPRRLGYPFIAALTTIGIAISFFVTYANDAQPMFLGLPFMRDVRRDPYFLNYYIKSHMRIGSYMVGVLAGIVVYDHKGSTWKLPKIWSRLLFIIFVVGFLVTSQSLGAKYYDPSSVRDPLESAAYAGLHRVAFAIGTCSAVVLITIGDGLDFHYNVLTPRWVAPLARLTYGAYILHNINQSYEIGVTRSPRVFTLHNVFWDFVPDMVYTFGLSLLLSLVIEGPLRRVEKMILDKKPNKTPITGSNSAGPMNENGKKLN